LAALPKWWLSDPCQSSAELSGEAK